jgi:hypothetical protein
MSPAPSVLSLTLLLRGEPGLALREREEHWYRCHEPLLDALVANDTLRVGLVFAGELLAHWEELHPERIERVRQLLERRQVELVGVPLHTPVLSAVPERDATAQVLAHATLVKRIFEVRPSGCWLPRRVWDPATPRILARAEMDWCFVDESALRRDGLADSSWGAWATDRAGHPLTLLGTDDAVLDRAADAPPDELVAHAVARAGSGARVQCWAWSAGRFGLRPERDPEADSAWLVALLEDLAASSALQLVPPSEALTASGIRGRTYLASWAPTIVGTPWERHLLATPESDRLHKKMLRVSRLVSRLEREVDRAAHGDVGPEPDRLVQAQRYLHRGQTCAAYEGAPFGGVADPIIRGRAWHDLLRAERVAHVALGSDRRLVAETADLGIRGQRDVLLRTAQLCCVVEPGQGAGLSELSLVEAGHNLVDVLTRPSDGVDGADLRPRLAYVEHLLAPDADVTSLHATSPATHEPWTLITTERRGEEVVRAVLSRQALLDGDEGVPHRVRLTKTFTLQPGPRLDCTLELQNRETSAVRLRLALEVCLRPAPTLEAVGLRVREQVASGAEPFEASEVEVVDIRGGELAGRLSLQPAGRIHALPIRTAGGDQGFSLFLEWPVPLLGREKHRLRVKLEQLP